MNDLDFLGLRGRSPEPKVLDSVETVANEQGSSSVSDNPGFSDKGFPSIIRSGKPKTKSLDESDKQKQVKWRNQLTAFEMNPLLEVYSKPHTFYDLTARPLIDFV